jgi:hypothetical protein
MSPAARKPEGLVLGGVPRADLLPPEIEKDKAAARLRSNLVAVFILVVFLVALAYGGASLLAISSQTSLEAEVERGNQLLAEQAKYSEVRTLNSQLQSAQGQLLLVSVFELHWSAFIADIYGKIPSEATIDSFTAKPTVLTEGVVSPLYPASFYTVEMTLAHTSFVSSADWIASLRSVKGYVSGEVTSVAGSDGGYQTIFTLTVDDRALWLRYMNSDADEAALLQAAIDGGFIK